MLWDNAVAEFSGEFYTVPAALRRAGRLAAGWMSRSTADLDRIAEDIAVVRSAALAPEAVRIVVRGIVRPGERSGWLSGSYDQIRADAKWLGKQGVTELYYDLNWDPRVGKPDASASSAIDRATEIIESLAPAK
jgi:hypothetical protein